MTARPWSRIGKQTWSNRPHDNQLFNEERDPAGGTGEDHCRERHSREARNTKERRPPGGDLDKEANSGVHAARSPPRKLSRV
jgi:hypothetical protein